MTRVILASASPGRRMVLRGAGIDPRVIVSGVDEDAVTAALGDAIPAEVVLALAVAKAERAVELLDAESAADCVVIGCDSMLEMDGRLRGKPSTADAARRQWQSMSGRSGLLHTGHCVLRVQDGENSAKVSETGTTTVHFGTPDAADLDAYVASGEPLAVAGGFTLDGLGGWFVEGIEGNPSNVIGLSLPLLRRLLAQVGISVSSLWSD